MLSNAELDAARRNARQNINTLVKYARAGYKIVGTSTSCTLSLKSDYRHILDINTDDARQTSAIAALITAHPPDVMAQFVAHPQAASFRAQLASFISIYGERTGDGYGSEATICTPTWREQPQQVLRLISPYLAADVEPPAVARERAQAKRDAQIESFCAACDDQAIVAEFRH